jgi:hypothetical protein
MAALTFPFQIIGQKGRWQVRNIEDCSDGDKKNWPSSSYGMTSPERYLIKLGEEWARKDDLDVEPGVQWYINKLPEGYAVFDIPSGDGSQKYKRLFGHPSARYYDSIPTFLPHFLWLQSEMSGNCECKLCGGKGSTTTVIKPRKRHTLDPSNIIHSRLTREVTGQESDSSARDSSVGGIGTGRARRDVKSSGRPYARDEEGTEDVYKLFIKRLEAAKGGSRSIEEDITEINSIDWRAEHHYGEYGEEDLLPTHLTRIEQQHSFIPRTGELVLFCPNFREGYHLMLDKKTGEHKYYSFKSKRFHGHPEWRAGVVTQVPNESVQNGPVDFTDLLDTPEKATALNTAGFRVETIPDPNDPTRKYVSKQYKYVPMRSIRPLTHWHSILRGIPDDDLHPSIKHALTCMTTVSLVEKFKAVGEWPGASIFCKGMFLGSEFIIEGDVVRLMSRRSPSKECTEVMIVESIRLNLEDVKEEHVQPDSPLVASKTSITLTGVVYTTDRRFRDEIHQQEVTSSPLDQTSNSSPVPKNEIKVRFRPVGSTEYGDWYRLLPRNRKVEVSYDQVLGRLYEAEAVRLWTGQLQEKPRPGETPQPASLNFDVSGITSGRAHATATDGRLRVPTGGEVLWYWADTRVQALDVATINGLETGPYYDVRDRDTLAGWREIMKILNGVSTLPNEIDNFTSIFPTGSRGRRPGSKIVNGKVVYPGDPGYPSGSEYVADASVDLKPKVSSQMAGAALASTDEEGSDDESGEDVEIYENGESRSREDSREVLSKFQGKPPPKKPMSKAEIMSAAIADSIEGGEDLEGDYSDENAWLNERIVLRGGTDESSGGDYAPRKEPKKAGKARRRNPSYGLDSD